MSEVRVKVTADNQTRTGFQAALGDARKFGAQAKSSVSGGFAGVGSEIKSSLVGALAGIGIGGFIKSTLDQFGRLSDLSEQFNVSSESLQRVGQIATEAGSSLEQVAVAFSQITRNVQAAQSGTGAQADALRALGLSAKELSTLSPEEVFYRLADAFSTATDRNAAYAATLDIIGARQRNLIPLLAQGGSAVREQAAQVSAASDEIVAKADQVGDSFSRIGQELTVGLGPAVAFLGQAFLTLFELVKMSVQRTASAITATFLAAGQAARGNLGGAGEIMAQEAAKAGQEWDALQKKMGDIWGEKSPNIGGGMGGDGDDSPADTAKAEADARKAAEAEDRVRRQVGDQLRANRRASMSDEELLADLQGQAKFLSTDVGGVSEVELERLKIVGEIAKLEEKIAKDKQIAADKDARDLEQRAEKRKSAIERIEDAQFDGQIDGAKWFDIDRGKREIISGLEDGTMSPEEAAARAIEVARREDSMTGAGDAGFAGSSGASSLQRIGGASSEFYNTPASKLETEVKRSSGFLNQIYQLLKKGEPLVLNANSN